MPEPTVGRYRVEVTGHVGSGGHWAVGLNVAAEDAIAPTLTELQAVAAVLAPYHNTFWSDGLSDLNAADTGQDLLTIRWYDPGASASSVMATSPLTGVGGASGANSPASTCIVATLQSEHAGPSGRGRQYWPATAGVNANHSFVGASMTDYLDALSALLDHYYTLSGTPWGNSIPSVLSRKMGAMYPITALAVDGRPDRQESRENGLVFARQFLSLGA